MKFIVFGLGNYGAALSAKLVSLGHEVIGVDLKMELVEKFKDSITHTVAMDAGSPDSVKSLPLNDVDAVINTIGENEGANIMLTALLKQIIVKRLICRVISPLQKTVLEAMDVKEFVYPEADSAERLAYRLDLKGVVDSFQITEKHQLVEVKVPDRYIDIKMREIDFLKYLVQPVTLLKSVEEKSIIGTRHTVNRVVGVLTPETILRKNDILVLFGEVEKLQEFIEQG